MNIKEFKERYPKKLNELGMITQIMIYHHPAIGVIRQVRLLSKLIFPHIDV